MELDWARFWFAVDRDDIVAAFDRGRRRSGPRSSVADASLGRDLADWCAARDSAPEQSFEHDLSGRLEPGQVARHVPYEAHRELGETLMFTRPAEGAQDPEAALVEPARAGHALRFERLDRGTAVALHDASVCVSCVWVPSYEGEPRHPRFSGLPTYQALCEGWVAGPYGRPFWPSCPLRLEQLPKPLAGRAALCRFDGLSFRETPRIQPFDWGRCESEQELYMDLEGQLHETP